MAMAPADISARPAVTTTRVATAAPVNPAARAKGTVNPSAMPITMSRTVSLAVKWCSRWRVTGMGGPRGGRRSRQFHRHLPDVLPLEQAQEGRHGVVESFHDRFSVLQTASDDIAAHLQLELRLAVEPVPDQEALQ